MIFHRKIVLFNYVTVYIKQMQRKYNLMLNQLRGIHGLNICFSFISSYFHLTSTQYCAFTDVSTMKESLNVSLLQHLSRKRKRCIKGNIGRIFRKAWTIRPYFRYGSRYHVETFFLGNTIITGRHAGELWTTILLKIWTKLASSNNLKVNQTCLFTLFLSKI